MNNNLFVLDSSAILAYLQKENGSEKVEKILMDGKAFISAANYAEIVSKLIDVGMPESEIQIVLENLELEVITIDEKLAFNTGLLRTKTRDYGLSLGDRACIALAELLNHPVLTTDKQWSNIQFKIKIYQLR